MDLFYQPKTRAVSPKIVSLCEHILNTMVGIYFMINFKEYKIEIIV